MRFRRTGAMGLMSVIMAAATMTVLSVGPTASPAGAVVAACTGSTLLVGDSLVATQCLANGQFELVMQGDGNLVTYDHPATQPATPVWSSGTDGNPGASLTVASGSLDYVQVVSVNGGQLWRAGQGGTTPTSS